ncbi:Uncharacterized protein SCF082_LOCUS11715 [Durusdinium trenchii]|uniref:Uncharacterized protein n=1 Tax=Durusdinium trenchii TaxID=1381693 RepID=A0ABP0JEW4_9DINO
MLAELQTVDRWRVKRLDGFCALQQRRVRRKFADGTIYVDSFHGTAFGEKQERIGKVQRTVDLKNADEVTRAGAGSAEEGMGKAQELDANQNIRDDWNAESLESWIFLTLVLTFAVAFLALLNLFDRSDRLLLNFREWLESRFHSLEAAWAILDEAGVDWEAKLQVGIVLEVFEVLDGPDYDADGGQVSLEVLKDALQSLPDMSPKAACLQAKSDSEKPCEIDHFTSL